jgi:hypothetical protein
MAPVLTLGETPASGSEIPDAAFVPDRLALATGNARRGRTDGADASSEASGVVGGVIQLRICSRASAGRVVNREPPVFRVSSVHASSPSTSTRRLCSENQKRILLLL